MKRFQRLITLLVAAFGSHLTLSAQNAPVVLEAETGVSTNPPTPLAGATTGDWATRTIAATGSTAAIVYTTCLSDQAGVTGGGSMPGTAARMLTYSVTFPGPGTYDLYARMRVGAGGANDDSFFYANSLGAKNFATAADWVNANGLFNVGYVAGSSLAVDGMGSGGLNVWKWVNLSQFTVNGSAATSFVVAAGALTQTFQIGAREDGLDFDKFIFGTKGLYFTVANLDAGVQGSTTAPVTFVPTGPALATGKTKYLGCAYSAAQAPNFSAYWNAVTPENGGKWGSVENTRGTFNWTDLDAAYAQAKPATGTQSIFRMHTLVWGTQQPTWMAGLSAADQLAEIKIWFAAVAARYPKLDFIDVVNEPIHQPPTGASGADGGGYINALGGTGTTGYDWIITAFQLARTYFPTAKLVLNEYSVENESVNAAKMVTIVNLLKTRGLIDAVGIQGHAFSTAGVSATTLNANLATLAAPGLPLYITEFDVDGLTDAVQLAEYQRVFPLFWENPAVRGVTLWGYRPGHWRTAQGAYLVNSDATERSSMTWLRTYMQGLLGTASAAVSEQVVLFPNPAQAGSVSLTLPATLRQQAIEATLLNALGQTVLRQTLPASAEALRSLTLPGVAPGLYTVRLQTAAGVVTKRLTVE